MLSYGFNAGWMPFVGRSDNYLNLFSSLLVFLELSVVQAIKAGMADENKWAVGVGEGCWWVYWAMGVWKVGGLVILRAAPSLHPERGCVSTSDRAGPSLLWDSCCAR